MAKDTQKQQVEEISGKRKLYILIGVCRAFDGPGVYRDTNDPGQGLDTLRFGDKVAYGTRFRRYYASQF
jgi:hypothetical protein